ncbi:hypothetical protein ABT082_36755, partial [Streptomyces massasporeus]
MSDGTAVRLEPHEIALLGQGPPAAVTVAVVDLHLRGLVEADLPGTIRARVADAVEAVGAVRPPSPLAAAVHGCLRAPAAPKALVKDPGIRLAVAVVRIPLAEAGLLHGVDGGGGHAGVLGRDAARGQLHRRRHHQ